MLFLCLRLAAVPSSRPADAQARRAQGPSRLAVAVGLRLAATLPGHALTGPSTARGSSRLGHRLVGPGALEGTPVVENRPERKRRSRNRFSHESATARFLGLGIWLLYQSCACA